ncbi:CGNR zinc finger domain-containing protein [Micromonospora peucetia]|uniref:CGNR zinc finger domain-containing protein n=1 Tax=Micromonospora peucetia TaxID=47871 RepID=UPI00224DE08D|nr:CGNR zinc finger domain-containing protein [Micromonospora peucetia]MCX4388314.1 CGNR zinc finger domain-containing protein [Micromonospora peucetia]
MASDAARPDDDAAPAPLDRIEAFVNTRRDDGDDLGTPAQLAGWLRTRALVAAGTTATAGQLERARAVREGIRALIAENNAEPVSSPRPDGLDPAARRVLAELSRELPLVLDVTIDPPRLVPATRTPVDAALAGLLAVVAEAVAAGTWHRLKACREPSCRWAYYDHSRNRRRTWCSMELCGNRAKARAAHHRRTASRS